jgi:ribosome biogenesis GTPase / thiamine phosphate phosphatase
LVRRREYDEDDIRVRPTRSSRPRTRTRPRYDEAVDALVATVDRGRYTCLVNGVAVTAMRARELGRKSVVVGDRVALVGDVTGDPDSLARIVRISERRSVLRRTADDDRATAEGRLERVVVANADQLVIVSALADPPPRTGFIDRCLVAAYHAGIDPLLCLTKADLERDGTLAGLRDYYAALAPRYVTCRPDAPLDDLRAALRGRMSVLVGHSGVGKSTLVNRLVPAAARTVGEVSAIGRGRHTSSSAVALPLPRRTRSGPDPGWIIDTPGVRSFGLAHVSADDLLEGFADLAEGAAVCPPHCGHTGDGCALDTWISRHGVDPRRLASYRRLLAARGLTEPS